MTTQITILGLGQVGASIGLALAEHKDRVFRCGHDPDQSLMKKAEKSGAIDKSYFRLTESIKDADIVVISLPVDFIQDAFTLMAGELKAGSIIINTAPLHAGIYAWAKKLLPEYRNFISMIPAIQGVYLDESNESLQEPHADLFLNSNIFIASEFDTDQKAIQTASELVEILKGKPLYADPLEVDGILAEVEQLPKLVSAALVHALVDQPGWKDGRRFASRSFARSGSITRFFDEQEYFGVSAMMNKENVSRSINNLITTLLDLKVMIEEEDESSLKKYLKEAKAGYENWTEGRLNSDWDVEKRTPVPKRDLSERLLGGWVKPKDKK